VPQIEVSFDLDANGYALSHQSATLGMREAASRRAGSSSFTLVALCSPIPNCSILNVSAENKESGNRNKITITNVDTHHALHAH